MPAGRSPPLRSHTIQTHGDKKGPTNLRGAHQGHSSRISFLSGAAACFILFQGSTSLSDPHRNDFVFVFFQFFFNQCLLQLGLLSLCLFDYQDTQNSCAVVYQTLLETMYLKTWLFVCFCVYFLSFFLFLCEVLFHIEELNFH